MSETETAWVRAFNAFSRAEMSPTVRQLCLDTINAGLAAKQAHDLGQHIATMHPDHERAERETLGDDEDDDEVDAREERRRRNSLMRVANAMSHAGMSEGDIGAALGHLDGGESVMDERRDFVRDRRRARARDEGLPRNAINGGQGGRLSEHAWHRRMAKDAALRSEFEARWPMAARIGSDGSLAVADIQPVSARAVADFNSRFPGASRLTVER